MQRRTFLKQAAATSAALSAPTIITARDKSGTKNPIVGDGEHRYECHHNWGELPQPHPLADDARRRHRRRRADLHQAPGPSAASRMDTIVVFDPKGKFVRSFGKEYYRGGHGIDIRKEGGEEFLYLCARAPSTWSSRPTSRASRSGRRGLPEEPDVYKAEHAVLARPTSPSPPTAASTSATATARTTSTSTTRTPSGSAPGAAPAPSPARCKTPHGIWLDDRPGRDAGAGRRRPGQRPAAVLHARRQARSSSSSDVLLPRALRHPRRRAAGARPARPRDAVRQGQQGRSSTSATTRRGRKKVLDRLQDPRASPRSGRPGKFVHPHDACFDKDGNIFVVEWVQTGRVTFLKQLA